MRLSDDGTSVDDWGEPLPRVSFLALPRTHTPGQVRTLAQGSFRASHFGYSRAQNGKYVALTALAPSRIRWTCMPD